MRNTVILPVEILDHIFSFLNNDPATLRSILKVFSGKFSPFLLGALDRHVYAHVVVTNFKSNRPGLFHYSKFIKYISHKPQVANYIHTCRIEIELPGPSHWYKPMTSILRKLPPTLKEITLSSRTRPEATDEFEGLRLHWLDLHEMFRNAFLDCLRSSYLAEVSLQRIAGLPLSIFNDGKIQRLSFRQVQCTPASVAQFPPQTISLMIHQCDLLSVILSWANGASTLRSFSLGAVHGFDFHSISSLSCTNLIDLELNFANMYQSTYRLHIAGTQPDPLSLLPDISHLTKLKELTIWASIRCRFRSGVWVYAAFPTIAHVAATSPSLQRLILHIKMDSEHIDTIANSHIWRPLVSLTEHSSLEHIEVEIISEAWQKKDTTISTLMGVPELKKMCEDSFLSVKVVVES